jgi:hypothetical protein
VSNFLKIANRACRFFTVTAILYTAWLAVGLSEAENVSGIYGLLFKNIITIFAFSCVYGASFLLFNLKITPAAKRVLHVLILYAAMLASVFIMAGTNGDARNVIIFIFIATLLYTVIYTASVLIAKAINKARK